MTSISNDNSSVILSLLLRNKTFRALHLEYDISYDCINVLLSCYVYSKYIKDQFTITNIVLLTVYYKCNKIKYYMNQLIDNSLIAQAGVSHYKITDKGISAVQSIADNYSKVLYEFCNKYNIDL